MGEDGLQLQRRFPIGAECVPEGGVHFRVWAPRRKEVEVVLEGETEGGNEIVRVALHPEGNGYFSGFSQEAADGLSYRFSLDGSERLYPDPASRFQPQGPFGSSMIVDPDLYSWKDHPWTGIDGRAEVIYEMHIGTFTREGTWKAAAYVLQHLKELGVTVIELMPLADFPGRFGWGYDGVNLFAPTRLYGSPDSFRNFVDRAHALGLGVILDVVYNHLGPNGNFLEEFSMDYFSTRYTTDWGKAINFDGPQSAPVREFYIANACYWISEYHLDGLRIDATQDIFDASPVHILKELTAKIRETSGTRRAYLVVENEPQQVHLIRPVSEGGYGLDAIWNDDFHHSAMVALTGRNEAYYTDYLARPQEFVSLAKYGFLYQGQHYLWQKKRRGTPTFGLPRGAFINFIQNHDQIANSGQGQRCHHLTSPGRYKAMTALLLLGPWTPMLFQGQEFASTTPFFYFADQSEEVAAPTMQGRAKFLRQFRSLAVPEIEARLPDPANPSTFVSCKLNYAEHQQNSPHYLLHADLLRLRRDDPVLARVSELPLDGAVLGEEAFVLRFFAPQGEDRLLVVNFGRDLKLNPAPEPLLAPPEGKVWEILWSSEDPRYLGNGTAPLDSDEENWIIPGHTTVVLNPAPKEKQSDE